MSKEKVFFTIEGLLALQNAGDVNGEAWQKVRNEAVEHLRKNLSETDHQN